MPQFTIRVVHDMDEQRDGPVITTFRSYESDHVKNVPDDIREAIRSLDKAYLEMIVITKHDASDVIVSTMRRCMEHGRLVMDFTGVDEFEIWLDSKGEKRLEEFRRLRMEEDHKVRDAKFIIEQRAADEIQKLDQIDTNALARARLSVKKPKVTAE